MVRIAYRTSSGIYGPKDATFPKVIRDVEMQLKRCRLREHSLKRCISVLLVLVAFCVCGLIVGLLSTCEGEDDLGKIKDTHSSHLKPMVDDTRPTTHEESANSSESTDDAEEFSTDSTPATSGIPTASSPAAFEISYEPTFLEAETTTYVDTETGNFLSETAESHAAEGTETTVEGTVTPGVSPISTSSGVLHNDINTIRTLSNIQETIPTCAPPHSEPSVRSFSDQRRTSSAVVQLQSPETKTALSKNAKAPDAS